MWQSELRSHRYAPPSTKVREVFVGDTMSMETRVRKRVYIPHPGHIPLEYNEITPYIYLGTNQCCQTHFEETLLSKGIRADISLEEDRLDAPFGVDYYLWLPVPDGTPPTHLQLLMGAQALKNFVDHDIKVYVHCKRGHGRSPTLVAAYFILEGMKATEAIKRVREKRAIHPRLSQLRDLREFEKGQPDQSRAVY